MTTGIFDNIEHDLLPAVRSSAGNSRRVDFCVGYFNLAGWRAIADILDELPGDADHSPVRILIGMNVDDEDRLIRFSSSIPPEEVDLTQAAEERKAMARRLRAQLGRGMANRSFQQSLNDLKARIEQGRIEIKLYTEHPLHAKLYLCHMQEGQEVARAAYVGSSNLTWSGLAGNGELNVAVKEDDRTRVLETWFNLRWENLTTVPVNAEILEAIEASWGGSPNSPYLVYLKMAFHLSEDARAGVMEVTIPERMREDLLDFQVAALQIAIRHLTRRGGVLIGDVVGLGKTMVAAGIILTCQERFGDSALILCPKNLTSMWQSYVDRYNLNAEVQSLSTAIRDLPEMPPNRLVVIDESHNLRNRGGQTYAAVKDYITRSAAKCVLLTATPYNKSFADLSGQLRLFLDDDADLGIRPEELIRNTDLGTFLARCDGRPTSIGAFEASDYSEDWRELMRLFMVRRTRSFVRANYANTDSEGREYLSFSNGTTWYFPERVAFDLPHVLDGPDDPTAILYSDEVVDSINSLKLPRYGLDRYILNGAVRSQEEQALIRNLSQAGLNLSGLTRTSLFKRLESSGAAFVLSLNRHRLRNLVVVHALTHGLDVPVGSMSPGSLDRTDDEESNLLEPDLSSDIDPADAEAGRLAYETMARSTGQTIRWFRPDLFNPALRDDLVADCDALKSILELVAPWAPDHDSKARQLLKLVTDTEPAPTKVVVFTEFADTARYLYKYLSDRDVSRIAFITGGDDDPMSIVHRFSPESNPGATPPSASQEIRVLIATDVLSEGQNLQDANVVVQYDLPWAIVKLFQRAGRVDRLGQNQPEVRVHSFLPADGIEQVIALHSRVMQRLQENGEVIGSDDQFFADQSVLRQIVGLYEGGTDVDDTAVAMDSDVDLSSYAYEIWRTAIETDPTLEGRVRALDPQVWGSRSVGYAPNLGDGVLAYLKRDDGLDATIWLNADGTVRSHSPRVILDAASCPPETEPQARDVRHLDLVVQAAEIVQDQLQPISAAGSLRGIRRRLYEQLSPLVNSLLEIEGLEVALQHLYENPLLTQAESILHARIQEGASESELAQLLVALDSSGELCVNPRGTSRVPGFRILCSMGLFNEIAPEVDVGGADQ